MRSGSLHSSPERSVRARSSWSTNDTRRSLRKRLRALVSWLRCSRCGGGGRCGLRRRVTRIVLDEPCERRLDRTRDPWIEDAAEISDLDQLGLGAGTFAHDQVTFGVVRARLVGANECDLLAAAGSKKPSVSSRPVFGADS